jgi:hypothetical protein
MRYEKKVIYTLRIYLHPESFSGVFDIQPL